MTPETEVTSRLLRVAWSALGGDASLLDLVEVRGIDAGLLPSTFAVLPAMVAAVSASTLAASVLDASRRSGSPAPVLINAGHVAAAARSKPAALPAQALDHATGYLAAAAAILALAGIQRGEPPQSVRLSLAQTAHWLTAAGTQERSAPSQANPEEHMVTLPGPSRPVQVIAPPGRAGDLLPVWTSTQTLASTHGRSPLQVRTDEGGRFVTQILADR